jgi:hypothetical protein
MLGAEARHSRQREINTDAHVADDVLPLCRSLRVALTSTAMRTFLSLAIAVVLSISLASSVAPAAGANTANAATQTPGATQPVTSSNAVPNTPRNVAAPPPLKHQGATRDLHQKVAAEQAAILHEVKEELQAIRPDVLAAVGVHQPGAPSSAAPSAPSSSHPAAPLFTASIASVVEHGTHLSHSLLEHLKGMIWPSSGHHQGGSSSSSSSSTGSGSLDSHSVFDHYSDESLWILLAIGVATLVVRDLVMR